MSVPWNPRETDRRVLDRELQRTALEKTSGRSAGASSRKSERGNISFNLGREGWGSKN